MSTFLTSILGACLTTGSDFTIGVVTLEADFLLEVVVFHVRVLRGVAGVAVDEDLRGINVKFVWTPSFYPIKCLNKPICDRM